MSAISNNLQAIHERMSLARKISSRLSDTISLLAVSKTVSISHVLEAIHAGQTAFGESYVQESVEKILVLRQHAFPQPIEWHFIGPIQSNKTRLIAEHFDWVHTISRESIAQRLAQQRPHSLPPLNVCIQVNISQEPQKQGALPKETLDLAKKIATIPNLKLRGLMAIPKISTSFEEARIPFRQLKELQENLNQEGFSLDTLSMGMSHDLEAAIIEGATLIRVGTAIFGQRPLSNKDTQ